MTSRLKGAAQGGETTAGIAAASRQREFVLPVRGQRVRVRSEGSGPPMVLVQGLGASLDMWSPVVPQLAEKHHVVSLDNPGAGRSTLPTPPFAMRDFAAVIDGLVDHLGVEQVDLVGYSFGGMIAQEFAIRRPHRVRRLALLATSCGWGSQLGDPFALTELLTPLRYYSRRRFERMSPTVYGGRLRTQPELTKNQSADRYRNPPTPLGYATHLAAISCWSSWSGLADISAPTLVVVGDDDPLIPVPSGGQLADRIPDARLEILPGTGHLLLAEAADQVADMVNDFMGVGVPTRA